VAFSPDGRRLAGAIGKEIKVWDAQPDPEPFVINLGWSVGNPGSLSDVVGFSADSRRIILFPRNRAWDLTTGREILPYTGPGISPTPSLPAQARVGGTERVGPGVAAPTRPLPPEPPVFRSPDGQRVASTNGDPTTFELQVRWVRDTTPEALERQRQEDYWDGVAWHYQQAADAEEAGQWFAATFHLSRLIEVEPARARLYARRAHAYTQLGQAQQAAADLAKAKELEARP
jgi:hypothetical protein